MASAFYQKYRLKWPWTPTQVTNVDQMFQEIYTAVLTINSTLDAAITTGLANAAPASGTYLTTTNQAATLPNSRQLFAGTNITFDDSVVNQRTINVASPTFTQGSVIFAGATGALTQDNAHFFWDDTNDRLGVGTSSPGFTLHLSSSGANPLIGLTSTTSGKTWRIFSFTDGNFYINKNSGGTVLELEDATSTATFFGPVVFAGAGGITATKLTITGTAFDLIVTAAGETLFLQPGGATAIAMQANGLIGIGSTTPSSWLTLRAGTATANQSPLKFTSGTNLGTAEAGAMEYNGTNLFFTRAGTTRENVLVAVDNATAPTTTPGVAITNFYGSAATNYLGDPNRWLSVNVLGSVYKIPLYT